MNCYENVFVTYVYFFKEIKPTYLPTSAIITLCLIQETCQSIKLRSLTAKICIRHNIDAAVACVKIYSKTVARNEIAMKENV